MKTRTGCTRLIWLIPAIALFLGGLAAYAHGDDKVAYIGEFCWSLHMTEDDKGPVNDQSVSATVRLSFTLMGDRYLSVQGILELSDGEFPVILGGSGVILGNEVLITVNTTQEHKNNSWLDAGIARIRIDLNTMNGTVWENRLDYERNTRQFDEGYGASSITLIACP